MLTGKMVRVKFARDRILPYYLDTENADRLELAQQLIEIFRSQEGCTRGQLQEDIDDLLGDSTGQMIHQGLVKLLMDRCEFDVVSSHPPSELRDQVFRAAAARRATQESFNRDSVLEEVALSLELTPEQVDRGLFADLKSEQQLSSFKDITAQHLLQRYNVSLAQAVLLRSTRVHITIRNETPQRFRQLFRKIKFHRLVCEVERTTPTSFLLHLDGPLSLFTATQKYGLQLAFFLPTLLLCKDFELKADLLWGPQRKLKKFQLSSKDGLMSHLSDFGTYVPPELSMFVELFRKRQPAWEIQEEFDIYPLGQSFWIPDFRVRHIDSGKSVLLEVLGFWRRSHAEKHLKLLQKHIKEPFLLAVSDQLHIDEAELEGLPAGIHRFRQMPLPNEIARLAQVCLELKSSGK